MRSPLFALILLNNYYVSGAFVVRSVLFQAAPATTIASPSIFRLTHTNNNYNNHVNNNNNNPNNNIVVVLSLSSSSAQEEGQPSDYDSSDLLPVEKTVAVDLADEDAQIRDALKRELLLLASVTNRGEFASKDELNIVIDLVTQLEALNPTSDPAWNCQGEWDLCLSSTQLFRSSPFFQSIRMALGDTNKAIGDNFFDLHDRATTASRIGRVRQTVLLQQDNNNNYRLISEVDLEVGILPGLPFRISGTVVTESDLTIVSDETWQVRIVSSQVKGSNIPLFNQFLDDLKLELPVRNLYTTILGNVPIVPFKTFYVDEGMRITRDVDDNIFVFTKV